MECRHIAWRGLYNNAWARAHKQRYRLSIFVYFFTRIPLLLSARFFMENVNSSKQNIVCITILENLSAFFVFSRLELRRRNVPNM